MRPRTNFQLARVFGIRIGVSVSWFFVLFFLIYYLSDYFHKVLGGSHTTAYAVAVGGAIGYFLSLILHELGHALMARRLGIPIAGIDLWFFGGLSQMRREPQSAGEEFKVAVAGPAVTLAVLAVCLGLGGLLASGSHITDVALTKEGFTTTPALALVFGLPGICSPEVPCIRPGTMVPVWRPLFAGSEKSLVKCASA